VLKVSQKPNKPSPKLRYVILDSVGYYDIFPPKQMSVSTKTIDISDSSGAKVLKRILVAEKDFAAGETIYKVTRYPPALRNGVG
jgi:hypothetical protein